jgi:hypothetical protein
VAYAHRFGENRPVPRLGDTVVLRAEYPKDTADCRSLKAFTVTAVVWNEVPRDGEDSVLRVRVDLKADEFPIGDIPR